MKQPAFVVATFVLGLLLPSPRCVAQYANTIGIYTDTVGGSSEFPSPVPNQLYRVYFVLSDPRGTDGLPVDLVQGFEFHVTGTGPWGSYFRTSVSLLRVAANFAMDTWWNDATYIVSFAAPAPVLNRQLPLVSWDLLCLDAGTPVYLYLDPPTPASVPGYLAYIHPVASGEAVAGATGTQPLFTMPEFAFGAHLQPPVATENATFGAMKALFR